MALAGTSRGSLRGAEEAGARVRHAPDRPLLQGMRLSRRTISLIWNNKLSNRFPYVPDTKKSSRPRPVFLQAVVMAAFAQYSPIKPAHLKKFGKLRHLCFTVTGIVTIKDEVRPPSAPHSTYSGAPTRHRCDGFTGLDTKGFVSGPGPSKDTNPLDHYGTSK